MGRAEVISMIETWSVQIPLRFNFDHAMVARRHQDAVIIKVTTNRGTIGFGEAIPRFYLTGETIESVIESIGAMAPEILGLKLRPDVRPDELLQSQFSKADSGGFLAAFCGIDLGVFDAWAHAFGVPGVNMLGFGLDPRSQHTAHKFPLSAPIGLNHHKLPMALTYRALGFTHFKFKISSLYNLQEICQVIPYLPKNFRLIIDANCCFSFEESQELLMAVNSMAQQHNLQLHAIEEPIKKQLGSHQLLCELQKTASIPLIVDEHLCSSGDAENFANSQMIRNLRLAKIGGFTGLIKHLALAKKSASPYMLGALVGQTSLLNSAARVALTGMDPVYTEASFSNILLKYNPFDLITTSRTKFSFYPGSKFNQSYMYLPEDSIGLGVTINNHILARIVRQKNVWRL